MDNKRKTGKAGKTGKFLPLFLLSLFVIVGIGVCLYIGNRASIRADASDPMLSELASENLVLLQGGEWSVCNDGRYCYSITLSSLAGECLFLPKAHNSELWVNGVLYDDLDDDDKRLCLLPQADTQDGSFQICVISKSTNENAYDYCLYLGPLSAVSRCMRLQYMSRFIVTGICLAIFLFSLVLFLWKRSERYLFCLFLHACIMTFLTVQNEILSFLMTGFLRPLLRLLTGSKISDWVLLVLYAMLRWAILHTFAPTRVRRVPVFAVLLGAAVLCLPWFLNPSGASNVSGTNLTSDYYALFSYLCYGICIFQIETSQAWERYVLSVSDAIVIALRLFYIGSQLGWFSHGFLDLQFHLPAVESCIFLVAFFLVSCKKFAQKFQEADVLNETLEKVNTGLEQKIEEKTQEQTVFIRSMLHNLKSPLFTLGGYIEMAAAALPSPEDCPAARQSQLYLSRSHEKALYVSSLLDQLFLLTQLDAGQILLQEISLHMADMLNAVAESARIKGNEKNVQVILEVPEQVCCLGDPLYLQQAFQNIADNAIVHLPENGILRISVKQENDMVLAEFADNGCGIPDEVLPHIFERYYSNRYGKRASSGLGLTISKELIERQGGSIAVQSKEGAGSSFCVRIPASLDRTADEAPVPLNI